MLPITEVDRLAAQLPPYVAIAAVVLGAVVLTLLVGLLGRGRAFFREVPALVFVAAGAGTIWLDAMPGERGPFRVVLLALAAVSLVTHGSLHRHDDDLEVGTGPTGGASRIYAWLAIGCATVLLAVNLGSYFGMLIGWEGPVVGWFTEAVTEDQSVPTYIARRFLWDDGVLSAGNTSLFYGAPTYALLNFLGFFPIVLRLMAPVATVLTLLLMFRLGRRFAGPTVAGALVVLYALNPAALFYGRYGSSPAGTALALVIALYCVWAFVERDASAWWMGVVTGAALFLATLQYAPGRIVVLVLLGCVYLFALLQWRRLTWSRAIGLLGIAAVAGGVWMIEASYFRQHYFLHARGEQFFALLESPNQIEALLGGAAYPRPLDPHALTLGDKLDLLSAFLRITVPQYLGLMLPIVQPVGNGALIGMDPPPLPLYHAPVVLLILLGVVHSLLRLGQFSNLCLFAWVGGATAPLLLTNRVDAHRMMLFAVPLTYWAALGVADLARVLRRAGMPHVLQHGLAAILIAGLLVSNLHLLYLPPDQIPVPQGTLALTAEIEQIREPVIVTWPADQREIGLVQLAMLERMRREPIWRGTMLPEGLMHEVKDEGGGPSDIAVGRVRQYIDNATVLFAPADRFRKVAAALQRQGVRVSQRGSAAFQFLRADAGAEATGVSDQLLAPLPTVPLQPTPTPIVLRDGPRVFLDELTPINKVADFVEPRMNRTWDGSPLTIGDILYDRGIGTHAITRLTFAVPPKATEFQAVVGIAGSAHDCEKASVSFEVRDQNNHLLFDSGLIDHRTGARPVRADLKGASAITLVTTDAQNGIDCDHANWAMSAFLIGGR